MTDTDPDIKAIFVEALDLATDAERADYLDRACAGSPGVRARVEALLGAIGQAGSFLETPALARAPGREPGTGAGPSTLAVRADSRGARVDIEATADRPGPRPIAEGPGAGGGPPHLSGLSIPARLGDFELVRRLGEGAMGVVFEARQVSLNRPVAVKMIRAGLFAGESDLRRFRLEAEAVAHLDHPRIVPIYGVWEDQDCHYFSMKLIRGGSLARRLPSSPADPRAAAQLVAEVARAIQHAHDRGILHRDLKPSNILLDEEGWPLVTDFGLAKRSGDDSNLTQSGAILGTPSYMAPEQALGHKGAVTVLTDVYGLGAVLYALLTGRPPFAADTILETIEQVRARPPVAPSRINPRVDRDLETICLRCLEKDPWRRLRLGRALGRRPPGAGSTASRSRRGPDRARRRGPGCGRAATRSSPACSQHSCCSPSGPPGNGGGLRACCAQARLRRQQRGDRPRADHLHPGGRRPWHAPPGQGPGKGPVRRGRLEAGGPRQPGGLVAASDATDERPPALGPGPFRGLQPGRPDGP